MAKNRIVACIKDTKTDSHGPLTVHDSERDLIISIQEYAKQSPDSLPCKHPNDFVVKIIGEYDQDEGQIHAFVEPQLLGTFNDLLPKK